VGQRRGGDRSSSYSAASAGRAFKSFAANAAPARSGLDAATATLVRDNATMTFFGTLGAEPSHYQAPRRRRQRRWRTSSTAPDASSASAPRASAVTKRADATPEELGPEEYRHLIISLQAPFLALAEWCDGVLAVI